MILNGSANLAEIIYVIHFNYDQNAFCSIDNFPPNITGKDSFTVMVGQNNVFNFTVEDIDSNITVGLVRGLPTGASIVSNGGSQYSVHYRPTVVTNNETLTIIATDPHSASSTITPRLYLCACANGGSCTLEGLPSSDAKAVIMNCDCSQGNYSTVEAHVVNLYCSLHW